jgi:hypothetical protein
MIAFAEDRQARRRTDPADDVKHGVGVTGERADTGLRLRHHWPQQRLGRYLHRISSFIEHDLFRKLVPTFRDHAHCTRIPASWMSLARLRMSLRIWAANSSGALPTG